jgi:hypothetical protein
LMGGGISRLEHRIAVASGLKPVVEASRHHLMASPRPDVVRQEALPGASMRLERPQGPCHGTSAIQIDTCRRAQRLRLHSASPAPDCTRDSTSKNRDRVLPASPDNPGFWSACKGGEPIPPPQRLASSERTTSSGSTPAERYWPSWWNRGLASAALLHRHPPAFGSAACSSNLHARGVPSKDALSRAARLSPSIFHGTCPSPLPLQERTPPTHLSAVMDVIGANCCPGWLEPQRRTRAMRKVSVRRTSYSPRCCQ